MCPETMVLTTNKHPSCLPKAGGIIGDGGTSSLSHPGSLPLPQAVVSKVIEVHCQWHLSMSSWSDHSDGSRHSRQGRRHWEDMHMKINLPIFKDKDAKDAVTYQSWRWDLMVYRHARCRDWYPLTIHHQVLTRLSWRTGMEFWYRHNPRWCVDDSGWTLQQCEKHLMCWIKSCSNCKWLIRRLCQTAVSASPDTYKYWQQSFPDCFPPDCVAELKRDCFYGGLPKWLKVMVAYLKAGPQVKMYSDYLRATREAEERRFNQVVLKFQDPNSWWSIQTKDH